MNDEQLQKLITDAKALHADLDAGKTALDKAKKESGYLAVARGCVETAIQNLIAHQNAAAAAQTAN